MFNRRSSVEFKRDLASVNNHERFLQALNPHPEKPVHRLQKIAGNIAHLSGVVIEVIHRTVADCTQPAPESISPDISAEKLRLVASAEPEYPLLRLVPPLEDSNHRAI